MREGLSNRIVHALLDFRFYHQLSAGGRILQLKRATAFEGLSSLTIFVVKTYAASIKHTVCGFQINNISFWEGIR